MIDQLSVVSSQQSIEATQRSGSSHRVERDERQQTRGNRIENSEDVAQKAQYKKVAKDMESLFAYQLLKVMRETSNSLFSDKKGNGYDTYMSLFDMEVSRLFAERGLGLQDAIMNWLGRMPDINNIENE